MQNIFISLMHFPGGENEGGGTDPKNEEVKAAEQTPGTTDASKEKGFFTKVKEALKDWSNGDQRDQEIDDATP